MLRSCGFLLLVSFATWGQTQTPRSLFDEGTALYSRGQFAEAAAKFEASYAARPVPVTKFNIARSWEQAGDTLKAIDAWQTWLVMSPTAAERPAAESALQALGQKLASLGVQAVSISSLPLGARVSIDGRPVGVVPLTVELTPTRHLIRLDAEGRVPVERTVVVQLDRPTVQLFELVPLADVEPPPMVSTRPVPLPPPAIPRASDFAPSMSSDTVRVHIEMDETEMRLYRESGNPNGECRAPCDAPVARATDKFFISGSGMVPSRTFVLFDHAQDGIVSMKVTSGSLAGFLVGTSLVPVALIGLIISVVFAVSPSFGSEDRSLPLGLGVGLSLAGLGSGIALLAANGTSVTFTAE